MFRRRADTCERTSGIGPCQGAPVPDRVHLAQSQGASPDRRIKQITLSQCPDIAPGFFMYLGVSVSHVTLYGFTRACELHSLVTLPILRIAPVCYTPIGVICDNSVRSSLSSFYLLPSVNTCFDIIALSLSPGVLAFPATNLCRWIAATFLIFFINFVFHHLTKLTFYL